MPFCPMCRAEYRAGFSRCKACGDVELVSVLPERKVLRPEDAAIAVPVGIALEGSRQHEVDGQLLDPTKIFSLDAATELQEVLSEASISSLITPLADVEFPDGRPRFQLRVAPDERDRAEEALLAHWKKQMETEGGVVGGTEADKCPACGAAVPLEVEECPDCGLVVGAV